MPRLDVRTMRREQIVDAMEPLVARQGWEHTTFAEICRAAGISNRVLTYHFKDKDDLLFAVFERAVHRIRENLEPLMVEGAPFEERLAFMLHNTAVQQEKEQFSLLFLHLMAQAVVRPEIAARLRGVICEHRTRLAAEIMSDPTVGHMHDDPESDAALMQSVLLGVMLSRCVFGMTIPPERVLTMLLAFLHAAPCVPMGEREEKPVHRPAATGERGPIIAPTRRCSNE